MQINNQWFNNEWMGNEWMMTFTNEQWWYLQWDGDDMYNEIMVIFTVRYLQWDDDDIYNETLMVFMMKHWWYLQMKYEAMTCIQMNFKIKFFTPSPSLCHWWFNYEFFCGALGHPGLKKVLLQRGHTNLTPKCTFCTWALMVACEVDGPSLQPSTQHWYMCFVPPTWTLRGCMWAGMSSSGAGVAAGEVDTVAWPAGSEASGPVDSWRGDWGMVALGARWGFFMGGWDGAGWGYDATPFRSP